MRARRTNTREIFTASVSPNASQSDPPRRWPSSHAQKQLRILQNEGLVAFRNVWLNSRHAHSQKARKTQSQSRADEARTARRRSRKSRRLEAAPARRAHQEALGLH